MLHPEVRIRKGTPCGKGLPAVVAREECGIAVTLSSLFGTAAAGRQHSCFDAQPIDEHRHETRKDPDVRKHRIAGVDHRASAGRGICGPRRHRVGAREVASLGWIEKRQVLGEPVFNDEREDRDR
jgi:hypothetical protein